MHDAFHNQLGISLTVEDQVLWVAVERYPSQAGEVRMKVANSDTYVWKLLQGHAGGLECRHEAARECERFCLKIEVLGNASNVAPGFGA